MMNGAPLAAGVVAVVLVCWCLGAYNRLVRLRQAIGEAFRDVTAVLAQRHDLIDEWLRVPQGDADGADESTARDAVAAACRQARAAVEHAAQRPAAVMPLKSLAMAEQVLRDAIGPWAPAAGRAAADAAMAGETRAPATAFEIAMVASDRQFALVCERFNAAADGYNRAARQFPTRIVATLFCFRASGAL